MSGEEININEFNKQVLTTENNILIIAPKLRTDKHILELIKKEGQNHFTILTTEPCVYVGRQWHEDKAEIFDMTTFLPRTNQENFIKYIIKTRGITKAYICNEPDSNYDFIKDIEVVKEDYIEDESQYETYEKKYKFKKTILRKDT